MARLPAWGQSQGRATLETGADAEGSRPRQGGKEGLGDAQGQCPSGGKDLGWSLPDSHSQLWILWGSPGWGGSASPAAFRVVGSLGLCGLW